MLIATSGYSVLVVWKFSEVNDELFVFLLYYMSAMSAEEDTRYVSYCQDEVVSTRRDMASTKRSFVLLFRVFLVGAVVAVVTFPFVPTFSGRYPIFSWGGLDTVAWCVGLFGGLLVLLMSLIDRANWLDECEKYRTDADIIEDKCLPYEEWLRELSPVAKAEAEEQMAAVRAEGERVAQRISVPLDLRSAGLAS